MIEFSTIGDSGEELSISPATDRDGFYVTIVQDELPFTVYISEKEAFELVDFVKYVKKGGRLPRRAGDSLS